MPSLLQTRPRSPAKIALVKQFNLRFGNRLTEARFRAKISQVQLAERAGLDQATVSRTESGNHCSFSLYNSYLLANVVNVPLDKLCRDLTPAAAEPEGLDVSGLLIHQLLQAMAALPPDAQEVVVSTAMELQTLLSRHGRQA